MSILIAMVVAAFLAALVLRASARHPVAVIIASGGVATVVGQLSVRWQQIPTYFRNTTEVLVALAMGLGIGAAMTAVAITVIRLIHGTVASGTAAVPGQRVGQGVGIAAGLIGLLALAGPYLATKTYGSVPMATLDPLLCVAVLTTIVAWLVSSGLQVRALALGLGVFAACVTVVPLVVGPRHLMGEPTTMVSAWVLAASGLTMLACGFIEQRARLQERQATSGARWLWLGIPLLTPVVVLLAILCALVTWSETTRAALHPSARAAFATWAARNWNATDRAPDEAMRQILVNRVQASPAWWAAAWPELLQDEKPELRFAALSAIPWSRERLPWPPGEPAALLKDPEAKIRTAALYVVMSNKETITEDEFLITALEGAFSQGNTISAYDLEPWLGRVRMVKVYAELVMRTKDKALAGVLYVVSNKDEVFAEVISQVASDPVLERRARCLDLLRRKDQWQTNHTVDQAVFGLLQQPDHLGLLAADMVARRDARGAVPEEVAIQASFMLFGAQQPNSGLMEGGQRLGRTHALDIARYVNVALESTDPRHVDGALRYLWTYGDRASAELAKANLLPSLLLILNSPDEVRRRRAAVVIAVARVLSEADRIHGRQQLEAHTDPALRMLAQANVSQSQPFSHYLVREVQVLLWADDRDVRERIGRVIAQAETDANGAIALMEKSGIEYLVDRAIDLRRAQSKRITE